MSYESIILGAQSNKYLIGHSEVIDGFRSVPAIDCLKTAHYFKSEYPRAKRYINVQPNCLKAVKAAMSTASGLYDSERQAVIAESVYDIDKASLVRLVMNGSGDIEAKIAFSTKVLGAEVFAGMDFDEALDTIDTDDLLTEMQARDLLESAVKFNSDKFDQSTGSFDHLLTYKTLSAKEIRDKIFRVPRRALLQCHTGFGKTSIVLKHHIEEFLAQGKRVLFISPLRSIVKAFDVPGLVDYQDVEPGQMNDALGLKVVVNSLIAERFAGFIAQADLVVIDEASQVIEHVMDGTVRDRDQVWAALQAVVKNAPNVVFADADINKSCFDLISKGKGPVVVFKADAVHSDIEIQLSSINQVRKQAMDSALVENTLIACDNKRDAAAMGLELERAGRKVMLITSTTGGYADQQLFLKNPNCTDYDVLIYSPAMKSAISITSGHFTKHFGLFEGSVSPKGAIQMLRRDRLATAFVVGVRNPQNRTSELVQVEFENGPKTAFEELRHHHRKSAAWLKDNIQLTLAIELRRQGFSVSKQIDNDDQAKEGLKEHSKVRRALKIDVAKAVLDAIPMTNIKAAEALVRDGASSHKEYFSAIRAEAELHLRKTDLSFADAEFWKEGEGKAKLRKFEDLHKPSVSRLHRVLVRVFKGMTETKSWTPADSVEAYDDLNECRAEVLLAGFNMPRQSKLISDRSKQGAITDILKAHGLKTKRKDGGESGYYYIIDSKSLEQMKEYTGL
ncbi:hypothetical protein GWQ44_04680 [Pseudomonas sp. 3MA1]|uniref:hypothetical protein n=1 Tax=Pseudomonas sp. 3MA1 TaxID=2699196 RepID=UPI0023DD7C1B|nr:hypothetical protein [Pseudomonas sp. 3MA1]MDF2394820.1 hypothetical protein [Pseudomonas sp. 3MA1]